MEAEKSGLGVYMAEVGHEDLLSPREEKRLARAARKGDESARDRLIRANLRFVIRIARGYLNRSMPLEDLIQEGNLGLIEGIRRFDPEKGFRLTTYVAWWINLYIQRALEQKARPIRIPANKLDSLRKIKRFVADHRAQHGCLPEVKLIAKHLGVTPTRVETILSYDLTYVSLFEPVADDAGTFEEIIRDTDSHPPERDIYLRQLRDSLRKVMSVLNPRERAVIERRFGIDTADGEAMSLRQVGNEAGLSAEGVRRVESGAFSKLRRPGVRALMKELLTLLVVVGVHLF